MPLFGNKNMIMLIRLSCDIHNFHNGAYSISAIISGSVLKMSSHI